jgi:hypothetical protein
LGEGPLKINIVPNLDQIRFIAESAFHAWDYQDLEAGRAQVIEDMVALLEYLRTFDNGVGVVAAGALAIEGGIRIERSTREADALDLVDSYVSENTGIIDPAKRERTRAAVIEDVWAQINRNTAYRESYLATCSDGATEQ